MASHNRRQRRAAATANTSSKPLDASSIPLACPPAPPKNSSKSKTLYDIAAERQAELTGGQPFPTAADHPGEPATSKFVKIAEDGTIVSDDAESAAPNEELPPFFETLFTSLTLSALHYTLSVLTAHQYAMSLKLLPLFYQTLFLALPTLTFLVHLMHGHMLRIPVLLANKKVSALALQVLWVVAANASGCFLINITNEGGYYAVMKKAPNVGTLWVWSVLELGLTGALLGVAGPGAYAWYHGYGIW